MGWTSGTEPMIIVSMRRNYDIVDEEKLGLVDFKNFGFRLQALEKDANGLR